MCSLWYGTTGVDRSAFLTAILQVSGIQGMGGEGRGGVLIGVHSNTMRNSCHGIKILRASASRRRWAETPRGPAARRGVTRGALQQWQRNLMDGMDSKGGSGWCILDSMYAGIRTAVAGYWWGGEERSRLGPNMMKCKDVNPARRSFISYFKEKQFTSVATESS